MLSRDASSMLVALTSPAGRWHFRGRRRRPLLSASHYARAAGLLVCAALDYLLINVLIVAWLSWPVALSVTQTNQMDISSKFTRASL